MDWIPLVGFWIGFLISALSQTHSRIKKLFMESNKTQITQLSILYSVIFLIGAAFLLTASETSIIGLMLFVVVAVPLLYAPALRQEILPKISQVSILVYTILFWYVFLTDKDTSQALSLLPSFASGILYLVLPIAPYAKIAEIFHSLYLLPTFGVILIVLTRRHIGRFLQVLFYSWFIYLVITVGFYQLVNFNQQPVSGTDSPLLTVLISSVMLGSSVFFLLTYTGYFFSLFPREDIYGNKMDSLKIIYEKYSQIQVGLIKTALVGALLIATLWINYKISFVPGPLLISLGVMATYYLDRHEGGCEVLESLE